MAEIRCRFLGDDVERVFYEREPSPKTPPKVEIVTGGIGALVFINGHRINSVLDIQLPVRGDEIGPQIVLKLHADEIVQRKVSAEEWKRLKDA